jgi:predicted small metal-binding protein
MNRAVTVQRQVDERDAALPAGKIALPDQLLAMLDGHAAGEINSRGRQGFAKAGTTWSQASPPILVAGGNAMQKVINCPCGFVLKGASDDEVVQKAQAHAKEVHQMDLSREQALAMAKPA